MPENARIVRNAIIVENVKIVGTGGRHTKLVGDSPTLME